MKPPEGMIITRDEAHDREGHVAFTIKMTTLIGPFGDVGTPIFDALTAERSHKQRARDRRGRFVKQRRGHYVSQQPERVRCPRCGGEGVTDDDEDQHRLTCIRCFGSGFLGED